MSQVALETIDPQQWARIKALAPWQPGSRITDRYGVTWVAPNGGGAAAGDWIPLDDIVGPDSAAVGLPLGLPGATAPTRYVGGTVSGPPTTGSFAVGDFVVDQAVKVWVCSQAGSPGIWGRASGGGTWLNGIEITSDTPTVTAGNALDVAGSLFSHVCDGGPIMARWGGTVNHATAGGTTTLTLFMDGVSVRPAGGTSGTAGGWCSVHGRRLLVPAAGSHDFKLQIIAAGGNVAHAVSIVSQPAYIDLFSA